MSTTTYYHSPLGWVKIRASGDVRQLDAYFHRRLRKFDLEGYSHESINNEQLTMNNLNS